MTYFLLLGTNQFAVVTDNRVQCHDNRKDNILTFFAIKTHAQKTFLQLLGSRWSLCHYKQTPKKPGRIFFSFSAHQVFYLWCKVSFNHKSNYTSVVGWTCLGAGCTPKLLCFACDGHWWVIFPCPYPAPPAFLYVGLGHVQHLMESHVWSFVCDLMNHSSASLQRSTSSSFASCRSTTLSWPK